MGHHKLPTVLVAMALLAFFPPFSAGEGTGRSNLPSWFVDSDVVLIAEIKNELLVITEVLKASKPFRVADFGGLLGGGSMTKAYDMSKPFLIVLSIPTPTDAQHRITLRIREFQIIDDAVDVDGRKYSLRDIRIALAMKELSN
jgi:hypothetical protein